MWKQIVEIEMQLSNYADRSTSSLIDRDHRFHAKLCVLARPDHARINRARGLAALAAVQRCLKRKFHKRDEPIKRSGQSDILYLLLQVNE